MEKKPLSVSLEQYLYTRGLTEPDRDLDTTILDTPELLAKAGAAWVDNKEAIQLVVRSKISKLREELELRAIPQEVPVLRQAIVELVGLLDDFQRYAEEHKRRTENSN